MSAWNFPETRYRMLWAGEWRPVTNMFDANNRETYIMERAAKAVLFVNRSNWVAVAVSPGDLHKQPGYKTTYWEMFH